MSSTSPGLRQSSLKRRHRIFFTVFAIIAAVHCFSAQLSRVYAQQAATATLNGRVLDPNGALVPGAVVAVTEKATGVKRETTTNGDGIYVLSNLAPGEYDVRVEAKGFTRKVSSAPVVLNVGQVVSLDARLEVNSLESSSTIIDLVEYRPLIDTNTSVVDGVIDSREGREFAPQRAKFS